MKLSRVLSDEAAADVDDIYEYTKKNFDKSQADKYIAGLFAEIEKRSSNPYYATRPESEIAGRLGLSDLRSFLYKRIHRCYFTFDDERLFVLAVYHGARDPEKIVDRIKRTGEAEF